LKPESLLGFEAGFTVDRPWGPIPDATFEMTAFRHNLDDAVVRITLSNPTRFMRINRDRIESTGIELLAGIALGAHRGRAITLTGDAVIQKIRIVDVAATAGAPRHAENNPERRGTLELGVPLPLSVRGIANARYTGRQYCLHADTQLEMVLPGKTEGNLAIERSFNVRRTGVLQTLRALVGLDNVGDVAIYDQCGLPQPGRTLRMMFSVR
jgi:iron complex outermembrane receptor protein